MQDHDEVAIGWRSLLLMLANQQGRILARWRMSNGAEFDMLVPEPNEILEESLAERLHWPFRFSELNDLVLLSAEHTHGVGGSFPQVKDLTLPPGLLCRTTELGIQITYDHATP